MKSAASMLILKALFADADQIDDRGAKNKVHNELEHEIQTDEYDYEEERGLIAVTVLSGQILYGIPEEHPAADKENAGIHDGSGRRRADNAGNGVEPL